jgi:enoyl-CoA hydratase/carnithine racemase
VHVVAEDCSRAPATEAALPGYGLGVGLELALAADFRIADTSAALGCPEVGIGILPSSGGTVRATRLVGPARTRQLILLGDRVSAEDALAIGLVTEVADDAQDRALELARRLAELPPAVVAVAKAAIDAATESSRDVALMIERLGYAVLSQIPPPA